MSRSSGALRHVQSAPFVTQQKGNFMKISGLGALAIGVLALAACNNTPQENKADAIEANTENVAENLEAVGANMEENFQNQADAVRAAGENQAEAVRDAADNSTNNQ